MQNSQELDLSYLEDSYYLISQDQLYTTFTCPNCTTEKTIRTKEFIRPREGLIACSLKCKYELRSSRTIIDYLPILEHIYYIQGTITEIAKTFNIPVQTLSRVLKVYYDLGFVEKQDKYYIVSQDGVELLKEWRFIYDDNKTNGGRRCEDFSRKIPFSK